MDLVLVHVHCKRCYVPVPTSRGYIPRLRVIPYVGRLRLTFYMSRERPYQAMHCLQLSSTPDLKGLHTY